uniref:Uncharacterized protein n=1 Tax=Nyssomyia neivai TaxID=330878 RepID=A0A1L8D7K8_9DIPT
MRRICKELKKKRIHCQFVCLESKANALEGLAKNLRCAPNKSKSLRPNKFSQFLPTHKNVKEIESKRKKFMKINVQLK